jgi:hypothetical protein
MALPQPPGMMRGMTLAPPDHEAIVAEALAAMDEAREIARASALREPTRRANNGHAPGFARGSQKFQ